MKSKVLDILHCEAMAGGSLCILRLPRFVNFRVPTILYISLTGTGDIDFSHSYLPYATPPNNSLPALRMYVRKDMPNFTDLDIWYYLGNNGNG